MKLEDTTNDVNYITDPREPSDCHQPLQPRPRVAGGVSSADLPQPTGWWRQCLGSMFNDIFRLLELWERMELSTDDPAGSVCVSGCSSLSNGPTSSSLAHMSL